MNLTSTAPSGSRGPPGSLTQLLGQRTGIGASVPPRAPAQWQFSRDQIEAGYAGGELAADPVKTRDDMQRGIQFLVHIANRIQCPHTTFATAATMFHRFYVRRSPRAHPFYDMAATTMFLASKVDENMVKLSTLCQHCAMVATKGKSKDLKAEAEKWERVIKSNEVVLMEALAFDFQVDPPSRVLFNYFEASGLPKVVAQLAIAFMTDSLRTTLVLEFQPSDIAAACLLLGYKLARSPPPADMYVRLNTTAAAALKVAHRILDYHQPAPATAAAWSRSSPSDPNRLSAPGSATTSSSASPAPPAVGDPPREKVKLSLSEMRRRRAGGASEESKTEGVKGGEPPAGGGGGPAGAAAAGRR
ncbi:hypothetical protein AMAG_09365 [Allomyces macrogynus ATCC 38327]|uniref:Cyclin-like domain-containing protein n=1 Tax=Allomyces macrogynus (strain ATCC 38327) TaxID=578462 RepID=A0A0L0SPA7_ALLM3|nr:hypothetical protein AMAG_09365 [Allomyces macrogynus ATCC 38327]|eukprot:KNE64338.1 hypothetical protein AMAG_09365 [Allomyces macrogynus ATCC 38327]